MEPPSVGALAWNIADRARNILRQARVWGLIEPFALSLAPRLVPPLDHESCAVLPNGLRLWVPANFPSARSYLAGRYEPELTRLFLSLLRPGWTVVDGGANVGYYTLLASRGVGSQGRVFAFEPDSRARACLERNVHENSLVNVSSHGEALGEVSRPVTFVQDRFGAEGHVAEDGSQPPGASTVPSTSLDEFLSTQGMPPVDLVKLDLEGSEASAVRGMEQLCGRSPHLRLIVEFRPGSLRASGSAPSKMADSLTRLGFDTGRIVERGRERFKVAEGLPRHLGTVNVLFDRSV